MIEFSTCSYAEFREEFGIPVRITIGHPRYYARLGPRNFPVLAPTLPMVKAARAGELSQDDFRAQYFALLDGRGVEQVRDAAAALLRREPPGAGGRLVLLCFERLSDPETFCHRTMFRQWWQHNTGLQIPELGDIAGHQQNELW